MFRLTCRILILDF